MRPKLKVCNFALHKTQVFWSYFGFDTKGVGVWVVLTKNPLFGVNVHPMETSYGQYGTNPTIQFWGTDLKKKPLDSIKYSVGL